MIKNTVVKRFNSDYYLLLKLKMAPITAAMDTTSKKDELVAILDAGAQYGKVFGFFCMVFLFELK